METPNQPTTPEDLGFRKFDFQLVITGTLFSFNEDTVRAQVLQAISINAGLLTNNPSFSLNVAPHSGLILAHGVPPPTPMETEN